MPINNRESNAPTNMLPYIRELEAKLAELESRLAVAESAVKSRR